MQPGHHPQHKPVMDVSAPPKHVLPAPAPHHEETSPPADDKPKPAEQHSTPSAPEKPKEHLASVVPRDEPSAAPVAVQQAPLPTDLLEEADENKAAEEKKPVPKAPPKPAGPGAPVGVIVAAVFVMLTLSVLAVMIYLTSQPS